MSAVQENVSVLHTGAWLWSEVGDGATFGCHRLRFDGRECEVIWTAEGPVELAPGEWEEYAKIRDRVKLRTERLAVWNGLAFFGFVVAGLVTVGGIWASYTVLKLIFDGWERGIGAR